MADVKYSFASLLPEYSLVGLGLAAAAVSATALELVLAAWRQVAHGGRQVYNLRQTINCLAVYAILLLTAVFIGTAAVLPYQWLHERCALVAWSSGAAWLMHLGAFLGTDLAHYTFHHAAHLANVLWAAHVTHHSSNDYNFAAGSRTSPVEILGSWVFHWPLALLFPLPVTLMWKALHQVYQLLIHTDLVPKMWAPIEWLFVTPSHHRVHHARNYGRRNYGGTLIVWDRLFGTFEAEADDRPCIYGLDAQRVVQGTYSPLWHLLHHYDATFKLAASGAVPAWRALLTREYGPGMVRPAIVDADTAAAAAPASKEGQQGEQGKAAGPAKGGKKPAVAVSAVAASPSKPAAPAAPAAVDEATLRAYPWELRPLGVLDYYAALSFLFVIAPLITLLLLGVHHGALSAGMVAGLVAYGIWAANGVSWVVGGTLPALQQELARAALSCAMGLSALRPDAPAGLATPEARAISQYVVAASVLSFAVLASQLPKQPKAKAA